MTAQPLTQERAVAMGSAKPWTMRWLRPIMLSLISATGSGSTTWQQTTKRFAVTKVIHSRAKS